MDVRSLYIIRHDTGVCLYHHDFAESVFDPHLLSSFIVAMTSFFDEVTESVTNRARAFEGTDYKVIVEFGEWTVGAISITQDSEGQRQKLKRVIEQFETQFSVLRWVDIDLAIYTRFERPVIEEFLRNDVNPDSVIHVKSHWEFYTKNPDLVAFLRLIPQICTVSDAAEFLEVPVEIAMNLAVEAAWAKVVEISNPAKPDDIYQATSLVHPEKRVEGLSTETTKALAELDGETPLSIAAERVRTADLHRFLEEISVLEKRRAIEQVSPAQAILVLYAAALQSMLDTCSKILGFSSARRVFFNARELLADEYPWLSFVALEEGVDVEIRSLLTTATAKENVAPETLSAGFRAMLQDITKGIVDFLGVEPANRILVHTRHNLRKQFPSLTYEIEWETLQAGGI